MLAFLQGHLCVIGICLYVCNITANIITDIELLMLPHQHFLLLYHQTSCYCTVALPAKYCCVSYYCTIALPVTAVLHYYCTTMLLVTILLHFLLLHLCTSCYGIAVFPVTTLLHFLLLHLCTSCYLTTVLPVCLVVSSSMVFSSLWRTESFETETKVFHVLTYIKHCTPATWS